MRVKCLYTGGKVYLKIKISINMVFVLENIQNNIYLTYYRFCSLNMSYTWNALTQTGVFFFLKLQGFFFIKWVCAFSQGKTLVSGWGQSLECPVHKKRNDLIHHLDPGMLTWQILTYNGIFSIFEKSCHTNSQFLTF